MPALIRGVVYLGDNGRAFCAEHAGASAFYSGRDLSGQPVLPLDAAAQAYAVREMGAPFECEHCAAGHAPHPGNVLALDGVAA